MEQEDIINQYLRDASDYKMKQGASNMAGSFANAIGSVIDYSALKGELVNYKIQANQIELQAKQRANQLREQFLGAVGQYTTNASRRGISVSSGSVRQNIESSAMSMGKDIQRETENARMKANVLRGQAKVLKKQGKAKMYSTLSKSALSMASGYGDFSQGYNLSGSLR